jgi:predicted nucleic acid-binding protein
VLGILLASKEKHLILAVRPILDALLANRFRLTPDLYEWLLAEAEETGPQR